MPVTLHDTQQKAHDFLKTQKVGVLATVDPDGNPHAAAIYFTVDNHQNIFFLTKHDTKKADNLRHHNHVMLVVYEAESQTTVQVTGTVTEINDLVELNEVFRQIISASVQVSHTDIPPISKLEDVGDYVAYKLTPKQTRMAVYSKPEFGQYKDIFKTVTPEA